MHQLLILFALLSATPAVAQWTVTRFTGTLGEPVAPAVPDAAWVALGLDPSGSFPVADATNNVVWRFRAGGVAERIAGTGEPGFRGDGGLGTAALVEGPRDAQADAAGNVYFVDGVNHRIRRIGTNGIITTVAGTGVPLVVGMDLEGPAISRSVGEIGPFLVRSSGDIYFADPINVTLIRHLTPAGQLEVLAGCIEGCTQDDNVPGLTAFVTPQLLALDGVGNLYFREGANALLHTIRRLSPNGLVTRLAGFCIAPCLNFAADGHPALDATFGTILAMSGDAFGNLFVNYRFPNTGTFPGVPSPLLVSRIGTDGLVHAIPGATALYTDATGRAIYRIGDTLYNAQDNSVLGTVPPPVIASPPASVSPPDGTPAQDVRTLTTLFSSGVSHAGELHFADGGCRIRKFDRNGILRTVATFCSDPLMSISDLAFDSQDRVWFSTFMRGVFSVELDGQIVQRVSPGVSGTAGITPVIAFDARDRLYIRIPGSFGVVKRLEADGTLLSITLPPENNKLVSADSMGNDPQGNLYVGGSQFLSGISTGTYRVNDDGTTTKVIAGKSGEQKARFAIDAAGRLWSGVTFTDTAGTSFNPGRRGGYAGDGGPVQSARFGAAPFPPFHRFLLAPDGSLYVEDTGRIRKLSPILQALTPVISIGGIVNSASYSAGPIAPGELISIFGFNFGAPAGSVQVAQAVNNMLPPVLGRTKVLFRGASGSYIEGAITAVTPTQINVFVPYSMLGCCATTGMVDIVVLVDDAPSLPMRVPAAERAFDLFALDASGSGQGAILNQDQSVNGPANRALRGTIVSLWGTGEGRTTPALADGALEISTPYSKPTASVTVRIGGVDAEVLYAGAAPTLPTGAFQINARIPPSIPPGNASVSVSVGSSTTTRNITVAVQ